MMYVISRKEKCDNAVETKGYALLPKPGGCQKGWDTGPSRWVGPRLKQDCLSMGTGKKKGYMNVHAGSLADLM